MRWKRSGDATRLPFEGELRIGNCDLRIAELTRLSSSFRAPNTVLFHRAVATEQPNTEYRAPSTEHRTPFSLNAPTRTGSLVSYSLLPHSHEMPTYDFRCPNGHVFEKFYRNMSEALFTLPCPQCTAAAERQMSGGAGLVFKGSGFYSTDYGKNAHRKVAPAAAGEGKAEGKSEGGGESSAEAKAGSKADKAGSKADKAGSTTEPKSDAKGEAKTAEPKPSESKSNSASGKDSGSE